MDVVVVVAKEEEYYYVQLQKPRQDYSFLFQMLLLVLPLVPFSDCEISKSDSTPKFARILPVE